MPLAIVTAPAVPAVDIGAVKTHHVIEHASHDAMLVTIIAAAVSQIERMSGRRLITQTWDLFLDCFPLSSTDPILVPLAPVSAITSVKYIDTAGAQQTWDPASYQIDLKSDQARIAPVFDGSWPIARQVQNAVEVRFVAGYGAAPGAVPEGLRLAVIMLAGHWYRFREAFEHGGGAILEVPLGLRNLVSPFKVHDHGS
jgi:uncharacterized phiE125 gp8 family phage protein